MWGALEVNEVLGTACEIGGYFGVRGVTVSSLSRRARGIVAEERGARGNWERLAERLRAKYKKART